MAESGLQRWAHNYLQVCDLEENQLAAVQLRLQRLQDHFNARYGPGEARLLRAPGRVNLIGEHTDYNGYPVMPLAIQRDVLVMFRPSEDGSFRIINTDERFSERRFEWAEAAAPFAMGDWGNYVKAAIQELQQADEGLRRGFSAVIDGTVPAAAGLASSSSLVVAAGLVFLHANEAVFDRRVIADQMAKAEHFVGTAGGGMDQAISLMGEKGCAVKIDFFPLRTRATPLPADYKIVICNSLIRAPKTESALKGYNRRPMECRIATVLLSRYAEKRSGRPVNAERLADLSGFAFSQQELQQVLGREPLSLSELYAKAGLTEHEWSQAMAGRALWQPEDGFKLMMRYRHVLEETARVEEACRVMAQGEATSLGRLMNESHRSCRDLYEISTKELDALVELALQHGAVGSRLTGAGFGGCVVNLVPAARVDGFMAAMGQSYYQGYLRETHPSLVNGAVEQHAMFATRAAGGAGVL